MQLLQTELSDCKQKVDQLQTELSDCKQKIDQLELQTKFFVSYVCI